MTTSNQSQRGPNRKWWLAIKAYCLDCAGSEQAVVSCRHGKGPTCCVLHPYRRGRAGVRLGNRWPVNITLSVRKAIKDTCKQCIGRWTDVCPDPACPLNKIIWVTKGDETRLDPSSYWKRSAGPTKNKAVKEVLNMETTPRIWAIFEQREDLNPAFFFTSPWKAAEYLIALLQQGADSNEYTTIKEVEINPLPVIR